MMSSANSSQSISVQLNVWCQTDVGLRREINQDSFLVDDSLGLYVVADGMGGHRGGEVASKLAVETLQKFIRTSLGSAGARKPNARQLMSLAYEDASHKIYDRSQESDGDLHGMGTTVVAGLLMGSTLYIGNVGDSRAYLFTSNHLWQLTEDHSLINEQIRAGLIKENEIPRFAAKNVITRSVGFERDVQVDVIERDLQPGDMILVCSDGLSGLVKDGRIAEICRTTKPSEIVPICINEAKKNGGDDNVTVMVLYAEPRSS
jgi:serine/threonine protein phosphatase PrpC